MGHNPSEKSQEVFGQETSQSRLIRKRRYGSKEAELLHLIRKCGDCSGSTLEDTTKKIKESIKNGGFDIDYQDGDGDTFLHGAIIEDMPDVANLFLEKRINVDIKNRKNKTPLQLAVEMHNFNHEWNIVISKLRNLRRIEPFDVQQMLKSSDSGFVSKTLDNRDYKIRLTPEDVTNIARTTYGWYEENSNVVFKAIKSEKELEDQLEQYKGCLTEAKKRLLTFIFELGESHWVTLVIAYQNPQSSAYRVDYFASRMEDSIDSILEQKIANINIQSFYIQLRDNGYDCGIFALGSAKIINDALQDLQQEQIEQKLPGYQLIKEQLIDKRIEFAVQLSIKAHDDFFGVVLSDVLQENEKFERMRELFTVCPINVNFLTNEINHDTLLHVAVSRKEVEIVKFLKKNGARVDAQDKGGKIPIEVAQDHKAQIFLVLQPPVFYKLIDVPGDGSCLFWSVALAYLTPVKFDDFVFRKRFRELFGKLDSKVVQKVKELIQIGNNIYQDSTLKKLITEVFRGRVVDKMLSCQEEFEGIIGIIDLFESENKDYFTKGTFKEKFDHDFSSEEVTRYGIDTSTLQSDSFDDVDLARKIGTELDKIPDRNKVRRFRFEAYLECMRSTKAWGGEYEINAMSKLLNTNIQVRDDFKKIGTYNEKRERYSKISLFYGRKNHYQFHQVEYSFLMKFVQSFLFSCETRLLVYSAFRERAVRKDKILEGGITVNNIVESVFFGYRGYFGYRAHEGTMSRRKPLQERKPLERGSIVLTIKGFFNLSDLIETFNTYPMGFRKLLVHAANDIFQSFEMQFEKIGFDYIPEVADDIVDKILKYYINKEYQKSLDPATIVEALVIDKYITEIPLVKYGKQNYNIRDLYENVGIVTEKDSSNKYYRRNTQKKDKSGEYGYRRLFIDEKLRSIYTPDDKAETTNEQFAGYKYVLDRKGFSKTFQAVFYTINEEIQVPSDKIVKNCLREVGLHIGKETQHLEEEITANYKKRKQSLSEHGRSLFGKAGKLSTEEETKQSKRRLEVAKKNKDSISKIKTHLEELQTRNYYLRLIDAFADRDKTIFQKYKELSEPKPVDKAKTRRFQFWKQDLFTRFVKLAIDPCPQVKEFTGRQEEIRDVYNEFHKEKRAVAVISECSGFGKTQLARKYASDNKENYVHIYEVSTENMLLMENSLIALAKDKLGMFLKEETSRRVRKKSLFIFHDVRKEDLERVLRIGTRGGFDLLLTSDQNLENVEKVEVTALTGEESKELIKKILEIGDESQNEQIGILVEKLKGFPLAIKQATTCIRNKKLRDEAFGIREYLEEYNKEFDKENSQSIEQGEYDKVLLVTLQISIEAIMREANSGGVVARVIDAMAYFGSDLIDQYLFLPWTDDGNEDENERDSIFELLERYSMINAEERGGKKMYTMHESVKKAMRLQHNIEREKEVLTDIIRLISVDQEDGFSTQDINHLMAVFNYSKKHKTLIQEDSWFVSLLLGTLNELCEYKKVFKLASEALVLLTIKEDIAVIRYEFACAMISLGDYDSALKILLLLKEENSSNGIFPPLRLDEKILSAYLGQKDYNRALSYVRGNEFEASKVILKKKDDLMCYIRIVTTVAQIFTMKGEYTTAFTILHCARELTDEVHLREDDSDSPYRYPESGYEFYLLEVKYVYFFTNFFLSQNKQEMTINEGSLPAKERLPKEISAISLFNLLRGFLRRHDTNYPSDDAYAIKKDSDQASLREGVLKGFEELLKTQRRFGLLEYHPRILSLKFYIARLRFSLQELKELQEVQERVIGLNHPSTIETVDVIQESISERTEKLEYLKHEVEKRQLLIQSERTDLNSRGLSSLQEMHAKADTDGHSSIGENIPLSSGELPPKNKRPIDTENTLAKIRKINDQQLVSSCLEQGNRKKRSNPDCLFSWDDIDKFNDAEGLDKRAVDKIRIDSGKFITYIKNSQDKRKSNQLVELVRTISNVEGNYKYSLSKIILDGGYENSVRNDRTIGLQNDVLRQDDSSARSMKSRIINAAGTIQLIRGLHSAIKSCDDGTATDCGLSIGGIVWSFASQPIENVMVKITPELVQRTGSVAGSVIPGTLGKQTKVVIRVIGAKFGTTIARGAAGALSGGFDIVDVGRSVRDLVDCKNRENSDNPCGEKEIRDSIASISFSGTSFIFGTFLTAINMPGAGIIVGFILMLGEGIYSGVSSVTEYVKRYCTTHGENWSIFWRTLLFQSMSGDVQHLATRHDVVNNLFQGAWRALEDNPGIFAYGIGFGEDSSSLEKNSIRPGYGKILMNTTDADTTNLSRVIPDSVQNATMICLPQFADKDYEKGIRKSIPTAVHHCENTVVLADYTRRHNGTTIIYNLMNVNSGTIVGSSEFYNEFMIFEGEELVVGGDNTLNRFAFMKTGFHGKINLGQNSTNLFNFSHLKGDILVVDAHHDNMQKLRKVEAKTHSGLRIVAGIVDNGLKLGQYSYVGRQDKVDVFMCYGSLCSNGIVESGGGLSNSERDRIFNYKRAIISPYTNFSGIGNGYALYIKTAGYKGNLSSSIDIYGTGTVIFEQIDLLSDCDEIIYFRNNNTLSLKIGLGQGDQYTLDIGNYVRQSSGKPNLILRDKNGSNIVARIKESESSTIKVNSFELDTEHPLNNFDAVENHYRKILNNDKGYEVFTVIKDKVRDQSKSTVPHMIFGSSGNDVITFDQGTMFAKGDDGRDIYVINSGIEEREVIIDNNSDDKELDVLFVTEVPEEFSIQQHNLHLNCNGTNVQVKNYFQDNSYKHLIAMNDKGQIFIPYTVSSVESGKLIPFLHATQTQNIFLLSKAFQADHVAIDSRHEDIEWYKDRDDLFLVRTNEGFFSVKIEGFYNDQSRWRNVNFFLWNSGDFLRFDLPQDTNKIMGYQDKLKADYEKIVKEYVIDFSQSVNITHNQNKTSTLVKRGEENIGVVILKNISPDQVEVSSSGTDLVLRSKRSSHTVNIKNWDNSESYRISTLEFDLDLDPIKIRRLDRLSLSNVTEIQALINKASENYKNGVADIETENDFKCLVSINGFENRDATHECLGFSSLQDQINFIESSCILEQINKLKDETPRSVKSSNRIALVFRKLRNNLLLNGYEQSTVDKCSRELKKEKVKLYIVITDNPLISAISQDNLNEFKMHFIPGTINDDVNEHGHKFLHYTSYFNSTKIAMFLLENNVDVKVRDDEDLTPLDTAKQYRNQEMVEILEEAERGKGIHPTRHKRHKQHHRGHLQKKERSIHLESKEVHHSIENDNSEIESNQATSRAENPSSWINGLFSWAKGKGSLLVSGVVNSLWPASMAEETSYDFTIQNNLDSIDYSRVDMNGTILLLDTFIRKITGQKYVSTAEQPISPLEAQGYALNIIGRFEEVVRQTALKTSISMHRLDVNFMKMQEEITGKVISGKFNEISGILKSYAEKACPSREVGCSGRLSQKKFDKFMTEFNSIIDPVINQSMQQMLSRLEISDVKEQEISLKPKSYLNGTSVQGHLTQDRGLRNQGRDLIP